ncbi:MAG: hypothetical protein QXP01_03475 [Candidatus Hadarchaeum sp.]
MAENLLNEEQLREISCVIAKEVFKDMLPKAYQRFEDVKRMSFPRSTDDISLSPDLKIAVDIVLILHAALATPRIAMQIRKIFKELIEEKGNIREVLRKCTRSDTQVGITANPGFQEFIKIVSSAADEVGIDQKQKDELLKNLEKVVREKLEFILVQVLKFPEEEQPR